MATIPLFFVLPGFFAITSFMFSLPGEDSIVFAFRAIFLSPRGNYIVCSTPLAFVDTSQWTPCASLSVPLACLLSCLVGAIWTTFCSGTSVKFNATILAGADPNDCIQFLNFCARRTIMAVPRSVKRLTTYLTDPFRSFCHIKTSVLISSSHSIPAKSVPLYETLLD